MVWINIGSWTRFGLTIVIDPTAIPTLINGITTSTSIVIAVFFAVLGILHRSIMEKSDPKTKEFYLRAMIVLLVPLFWLWTTYVFLTIGLPDFAIRYALSGLLTALIVCIGITIVTVTRMASEIERKSEEVEPNKKELETRKTTDQTSKKRRKWLSIKSLTLIALIINTSSTVYFYSQNQNTQSALYNLQYSLHNYQPLIFSIRDHDAYSTLNTLSYPRNDILATLFGNATVDLKVITPYDSLLTINVTTLNFTHIDRVSPYLDMNNLNYSEHSVSYLGQTTHQYFIPHDATYSINEGLLVELTVVLKPNLIPLNVTAIGFDLGDLIFEGNLVAIRENQTTIKTFTENVFGMFTPTS